MRVNVPTISFEMLKALKKKSPIKQRIYLVKPIKRYGSGSEIKEVQVQKTNYVS